MYKFLSASFLKFRNILAISLLVLILLMPDFCLAIPLKVQLDSLEEVKELTIPIHITSNFLLAQQRPSVPPRRDVFRRFRGWFARFIDLGRRGDCSNLNPPLLALVPPLPALTEVEHAEEEQLIDQGLESGYTVTFSSRPILWFRIPQLEEKVKYTELMVQYLNEKSEEIDLLEQPVQFSLASSEVIGVQFPETMQELAFNQPYHWYFSLVCAPERPSRNPSVDGWIQREISTLSLEENIQTLEILYESGNWHEAMMLLIQIHCQHPDDPEIGDYWAVMVNDLNLENLGISETTRTDSCRWNLLQPILLDPSGN